MPVHYRIDQQPFLDAPNEQLARMREEGDLARIKIPILGKLWVTTNDQAARALLKDTRFCREPKNAGRSTRGLVWWLPPSMRPMLSNMLIRDDDEHKRLRGLVEEAFSRTSIEDMHGEIARIADELLDTVDPKHEVDISRVYSRELPVRVICLLLGIREEERERIVNMIAPISSAISFPTLIRALFGLRKLLDYFREEFERVQSDPSPGLIHELVHARSKGDRLSEEELLSMVVMLFVAGHETTVHLINDGILAIAGDGAHRKAFFENPSLAIEEFMRFYSPVMMSKPMFAREDCEFGGQKLRRGDKIAALLIGANHDPKRFDDADNCKLDRRPNAHLGFGFGPHICLGMQLARAEARIALERLFTRFPNARLVSKPKWSPRAGLHGPAELPILLKAE